MLRNHRSGGPGIGVQVLRNDRSSHFGIAAHVRSEPVFKCVRNTHAPRLLVAFGERRERFPNAAALQKYAGVAPVTERSGNKSWVHWRYSCRTFLRQTFVEWVGQTIPRSFWAKTFYEARRARGARHQAALRALAFKWIRVVHRCWIDRIAYDESRYLMALQKRQAPLLKFAADSRT